MNATDRIEKGFHVIADTAQKTVRLEFQDNDILLTLCGQHNQHLSRIEEALEISIDSFGIKNRTFLLENDFIPSELIPAYESLSQDLIERIQLRFKEHGPLIKQRIHGDCHRGNILWKDGSPNFVDFDDTMMGPAIQDIWMMLSGDRNQKQGQLLELVEGYNEFCDFRASELTLIESFRTLRIINYSAWLARRWKDPAFPQNFPWFNTQRYWSEHILELREQLALLDEPTLEILY